MAGLPPPQESRAMPSTPHPTFTPALKLHFLDELSRHGNARVAAARVGVSRLGVYLARASELSPFDLGLRMTVAMQELHDGRAEAARFLLVPVAYNPHGGSLAQAARRVLERIAAEPDWRGDGTVIDPATKGDDEGGDSGA
jgi:hypothetical protein